MRYAPISKPICASALILFVLCHPHQADAWPELDAATLPNREFALFHDAWAIGIPGGKPLRFGDDGTVDCHDDANYHGTSWSVRDGILRIGGSAFTYNSARDCWFSPISDAYPGQGACIVPKGRSPKPFFRETLDVN